MVFYVLMRSQNFRGNLFAFHLRGSYETEGISSFQKPQSVLPSKVWKVCIYACRDVYSNYL